MSLPAPFGKYELLEQIGSGGMADVFLARSFGVAGFEKRLVVKRIKPEHARDPRFVSLFIHEAKVGVHLTHPNIVQVYELGKVGDDWYIAMEHLHGRDLNQVVRALRGRGERLPVEIAVRLVAEVLRGLAFAHGSAAEPTRLGLVHRDVSPHNVFVTFAGEVKLVDFGIARTLDTEGTIDGGAAPPGGGKFAYMSPEQAAGRPVDHRTDLFSAGIVLWELLAGERLYQSQDPDEKLRRVREAIVPDPRSKGADVDDELVAILRRALAKDPGDRYEDAAAFDEDLRAWLYDRRQRPGRASLSRILEGLFPDEARRNPAAPDLRRLADDLGRLDGEDGRTHTGSDAPSGAPVAAPALVPSGEERKRVVAVVADIDGFTDLSRHAEPEALFKRHLQLLRWLRRVVDEHGGTLQHVHDDQATMLFGVPRTRADDLPRALDFVVTLQRRVPELHDQGMPIAFAIGVHTGELTVGHAGSRLRYMARGNTTRLARRLSEQADHGQVLVSDEVHRLAEATFTFDRGPWVGGRGGRPPTPTHLLAGRRAQPRTARRGPWLRRGDELDTIRDALVRAAGGLGTAVLLHGDGGSGKTRLVEEIAALARRRHVPVHLGRAVGFGHPHAALAGVLRSALGLEPGEGATSPTLGDRLRQLGLLPRDVEVLEALLDLRDARVDVAETWAAFRRVLVALAQVEPVVVVLEDVDHLPARELRHLADVADRLAEQPVLLLVTATGPVPDGLDRLDTVALGPLSPALQARMVAAWLEADRVDEALLRLVTETCEGNPLYIEELVKYLLERKLVRTEDGVARIDRGVEPELPDSLAGLLAARIDALDPASKGALQIAAVLGSVFPAALLGDVVGLDDPEPLIRDLAAHGLVRRAEGADSWSLTSDFVRRAALHGILGVQRRDYHRLIAGAIERRVGQDPDWAEVLADHCGKGGRPLDAARYAYGAGQRHEEAQALDEARTCYKAGLAWIGQVEQRPDTYEARVQGEAMLRLRLGAVQLALGETRHGLSALRACIDVAEEARLPWLEVRAHLELGRHHLGAGELPRARAHLAQAWSLARLGDDRVIELDVATARAQLALAEGRPDDAVAKWRELLDRTPEPDLRTRALAGLADVHVRRGAVGEARAVLGEALDVARTAGDRAAEGRALRQLGLIHALADEPDDAVRVLRRAAQVGEETGSPRDTVVDHHHIGDVHFLRGDLTRAWLAFRQSRELAEEVGWGRGVALNDVYLGYIDARRGDASGRARLEAAVASARRSGDAETATCGAWLLGRLAAADGRVDEARQLLEGALATAERRQEPLLATAVRRSLDELPA